MSKHAGMTDPKKPAQAQESASRTLADELLEDFRPPARSRPASQSCSKCGSTRVQARASLGDMLFLVCLTCRHRDPIASLDSPIMEERVGLDHLQRTLPGPYYGPTTVAPEADVSSFRRGIVMPRSSDDE